MRSFYRGRNRCAARGTASRTKPARSLAAARAGIVLDAATLDRRRLCASSDAAATLRAFETEIDGTTFFGAATSIVDENAGTIVQVHLFAAQPQGSVLAVIQLTGSCAGARAGTEVDLIRSIMKTLRINP